MRKRLFFCLLLWLASTSAPVHAQLLRPFFADSLRQAVRTGKPDSIRVRLGRQLANQFLSGSGLVPASVDSAARFAKQALFLSLTLPFKDAEAQCLAVLGKVYARQGILIQFQPYGHLLFPLANQANGPLQQAQLWYRLATSYHEVSPEAIMAAERALALFQQLGEEEQAALALRKLADIHQRQGKYAQALGELMQVLRIQKSLSSNSLHVTYDLLSHIYFRLGVYDQALPYALASVESARATADTTSLYSDYYRIGLLYSELGQEQKSLEYFKRLIAKLQREKGPVPFLIACVNQVDKVLLKDNRPREALAYHRQMLWKSLPKLEAEQGINAYGLALIYLALDSADQAEKHLVQVLKMAAIPDKDLHSFVFKAELKLCQLYAEKKQYTKARYYLQEGFRFAEQYPKLRSQVHMQAFKLDSLQGNLTSAIAHYQQGQAINDSLFSEKKSNQLLGFQVQYETRQKEQALKLNEKSIALLTQQSNVQQARLGQHQTLRNALLGGTGLLVLLLGLGYNRYRLKQRNNQLLEAHQEEIYHKNEHLSELLSAQILLLTQKDLLLVEKEWLLKEIHHRVKNNLQIVMSLLNSQAASLQNPPARAAIRESQHRVQAMVLIHQKLYQSDNVARIPMPAYLEEVAAYLHESYNLPQSICLELVVDDIKLDVALAVPLGLIVNEVLTNAFKYAFPEGRPGTISIGLHRLESTTYVLTIADDGVGLPPAYKPASSRSLGMTLLHGFSEQLGGELLITSSPGLCIRLFFAEEQLVSTPALPSYAF